MKTKTPLDYIWIVLLASTICLLETTSNAAALDLKEHQKTCTAGQLKLIEAALSTSKKALRRTSEELGSPNVDIDKYTKWFGVASSNAIASVKEVYDKALTFSAFQTFWCPLSNTPDLPWHVGELVAVLPDQDPLTIYYAPPFFKLKDSGPDSRAGTIVHELTHQPLIGPTDDIEFGGEKAYGPKSAKNLAAKAPELARKNADNYQYYLEDVFFGI